MDNYSLTSVRGDSTIKGSSGTWAGGTRLEPAFLS